MNIYTDTKTIQRQTTKQTGAEAIVSTLVNNGIDTIFGYPGSPILPVYEAIKNTNGLRHILSRHEQGAVHSAEGWAKVSGKCGVVLVTSGPGFTNTISGIANANTDNTPLLIITSITESIGRNEFQDIDIETISKSVAKGVYIISKAEDTSNVISQALEEANRLPKGVIVVGVKKNVLDVPAEQKLYKKRHEIKVEAPHSCVLKTIDKLKNANRPLIIAGGGCSDAEDEVKEFCRLTNIPMVHTLMAAGSVNSVSMGMIGVNGNSSLNDYIKKADVVLVLGAKLSDRTTGYVEKFLPKSKIISINIKSNTSKNVSLYKEIIGEMKVVLQQMIGVIKAKNILFDIKYDWLDALSMHGDNIGVGSEYSEYNILRTIHEYTKKYKPIVTTDVGIHQIVATEVFKVESSKNLLTAGGFGTMGYGLPAGIGAYLAKPNSLVINVTGDGSFQMNIQELATCVEYNIPLKIIIMNNSSLGMIREQQIKNGYAVSQSDMLNPDFVKLAEAYGILGYRITNMAELNRALKEMFTYKKAVLLDIKY